MAAEGSGKEGQDVLVLLKALRILEIIAADKIARLADLPARADVSKSAAFRILSTLERHGYVDRVASTREFRAGPRLIGLSLAFAAGVDIITVAAPFMRALRDRHGETVNLGILSGREIRYVDILEGSHGLRMSADVGSTHDLHSTALGLAILSRMSDDEACRLLGGALARSTSNTLVDIADILAELEAIRRRGYAIDDQFNEVGASCAAAAIRMDEDGGWAAISISGPTNRLTDAALATVGLELKDIASRIEATLNRQPAVR